MRIFQYLLIILFFLLSTPILADEDSLSGGYFGIAESLGGETIMDSTTGEELFKAGSGALLELGFSSSLFGAESWNSRNAVAYRYEKGDAKKESSALILESTVVYTPWKLNIGAGARVELMNKMSNSLGDTTTLNDSASGVMFLEWPVLSTFNVGVKMVAGFYQEEVSGKVYGASRAGIYFHGWY